MRVGGSVRQGPLPGSVSSALLVGKPAATLLPRVEAEQAGLEEPSRRPRSVNGPGGRWLRRGCFLDTRDDRRWRPVRSWLLRLSSMSCNDVDFSALAHAQGLRCCR